MNAQRFTSDQRKVLRRKRNLIILGNLIIVCTFIVRDVLRDKLKERLDNLNNGQLAYLARFDLTALQGQLIDFRSDVNQFIHRLEMHETGIKVSEDAALQYELEIAEERVVAERLALENIEALLRSMKETSPEYQTLKEKSDNTSAAFLYIQNQTNETVSRRTYELLKIRATDESILPNVMALGQRCWDSSKNLGDGLEKWYLYINCAFFLLFILGVGLNVYGAFSGLDIHEDSL